MTWRVAKALDELLGQINAKWPNRAKDSDGSIGDEAHASRSSDHNPWVREGSIGIVTARDFTHDPKNGFDSYAFGEHLRLERDPRIKYVISNRRIFSSSESPWVWRKYSGSNPHDHHVHVSVRQDKFFYDDQKPWNVEVGHEFELPLLPPTTPMPATKRPVLKEGSEGIDVGYLQRMLAVPESGVFDAVTKAAVIEFQKRYGLVPDGRVGPYTWRQLEE